MCTLGVVSSQTCVLDRKTSPPLVAYVPALSKPSTSAVRSLAKVKVKPTDGCVSRSFKELVDAVTVNVEMPKAVLIALCRAVASPVSV